jgi:hypothetical protein
MEQMEEWRIIKDFPNYSVSNLGNVRNNRTQYVLKPKKPPSKKYQEVNLGDPNKTFLIHVLVAEAFIEKPNDFEKFEVDHIDSDKLNNKAMNLRWATRSQNQRHKPKQKNSLSKYKGVSKCAKGNAWSVRKPWRARIRINKTEIHLGTFDTEEEAAKAYNKYILDNNLGEFSFLNEV